MTINSIAFPPVNVPSGFADGIGKKAKSGTFADLAQKFNVKDNSLITESGKSSKGDKTLTEAQKQYLRDKYNLSGLSGSDFDALTTELTNMGALSYQDYKVRNLRFAYGFCSGNHGAAMCPPIKASKNRLGPSSGDYLKFYQQCNEDEREQAEFSKKHGYDPFQDQTFGKYYSAHQRVAKLLESLNE